LQFTLQAQQHSDELTNAIQVAIERNNNLNSFMRNFADLVRLPIPVKRPVHIIPLLQNVTGLMQLRAGEKDISFQYEHHNEAFIINADIQQMEQALINIVKNAVEAIEEKGTIVIIAHSNPKYVIIRDSGKGISPGFEEHLFSPFYTTKKDGQGIGLTVIREILFNHGFDFSLKTFAPGVTEFRINFE
jgi:two-component system, NtrC family, nitrogen regulation sensor histidine kinase NtrY